MIGRDESESENPINPVNPVQNSCSDRTRLVVATNNAGKLREISAILAEVLGGELAERLELVTPASIFEKAPEFEETGETFAENAVGKAEIICRAANLPALADDSGLCVDALGGDPGVRSARWLGDVATDADRNAALLERLATVPSAERTASFVCCMALAIPGKKTLTAEGTLRGSIASKSTGCGGFGYDPIFFIPNLGRTLAEIGPDDKNSISHRRQAVTLIAGDIRELIAFDTLNA